MATKRPRLPDELEQRLGRPILYRPKLSRLCNNQAAGILLSQALYWSSVCSDSDGWFYKTAAEWQRETCLSVDQQDYGRKILRARGFWQEERRGVTGTLHYRVDLSGLSAALVAFDSSANSDSVKLRIKTRRKPKSSFGNSAIHSKESESTSEITDRPIPPAPLSKGGERTISDIGRCERLSQEFKQRLKQGLQDSPINSPNCPLDTYDKYFRDVAFSWNGIAEVRVMTDDPEVTTGALARFGARMRKLAIEVFGGEVKFTTLAEGDE